MRTNFGRVVQQYIFDNHDLYFEIFYLGGFANPTGCAYNMTLFAKQKCIYSRKKAGFHI
jgi:hypothetical protein